VVWDGNNPSLIFCTALLVFVQQIALFPDIAEDGFIPSFIFVERPAVRLSSVARLLVD